MAHKKSRGRRGGRWVQHALRHHRKGALHRRLHVAAGHVISMKKLREAHAKAKRQLHLATTAREKAAARKFLGQVQFAINQHKFRR